MDFPQIVGPWTIVDSGPHSGVEQMLIDERALWAMTEGGNTLPLLRFFQWNETVATYGYLVDPNQVLGWAEKNGIKTIVKRPTGGGAVIHTQDELCLSLLWPRRLKIPSDHPRLCYRQIHSALRKGLAFYFKLSRDFKLKLYSTKPAAPCRYNTLSPSGRLSVCFQEPVCNDVMLENQKVIGGALRLARNAILYQGAIQLRRELDIPYLKSTLLDHLAPLLNPAQISSKNLDLNSYFSYSLS